MIGLNAAKAWSARIVMSSEGGGILDDNWPDGPAASPRYRAAQAARVQRVQAGRGGRPAWRRAVDSIAHRDRQGADQVGVPEPDARDVRRARSGAAPGAHRHGAG